MPSIFKPGQTLFGRFILLRLIFNGGQAEVWEVKDRDFDRSLALKIRAIEWENRHDPEFVEKNSHLVYEEDLLSKPSRFTVTVHDRPFGPQDIDGVEYMVATLLMDLATEGSLADFIKGSAYAKFTTVQKLELAKQLAEGLRVLQKRRIVHNDIKPDNILVTQDGVDFCPAYADLGYSFRLGDPPSFGGTRPYMAPERLLETGVTPSFITDIFSLGIVFYEILVGEHPLGGVDSAPGMDAVFKGAYSTHEYLDAAPLEPEFGRPLVNLVQRMGARDGQKRPTIDEVITDLDFMIRDAKHNHYTRSSELAKDLYGRWRWDATLHKPFGETERLIFLRGMGMLSNAHAVAERLEREEIYGFSVFRILGDRDLLLRVWLQPGAEGALNRALRDFSEQNRTTFDPIYRFPRMEERDKPRFDSTQKVFAFLEAIAADQGGRNSVLAAAQKSLVITGSAKRRREHEAPRAKAAARRAVRVICSIRLDQALRAALTDVVLKEIYAAIKDAGLVDELEILANPGSGRQPSEFIVILEVERLHSYATVLEVIEKRIMELLDGTGMPKFSSYIEVDGVPAVESYDGGMLHDLHRLRRRNHGPGE